jgi:fluoroquinolone resistance protein
MDRENNYFEGEEITSDHEACRHSLDNCQFIDCNFVDVDFSEQTLRNVKFIECNFQKCNLSNIRLMNVTIRDVSLSSCKVIGVNFSDCEDLFHFKAKGTSFDYSVFQRMNAPQIILENCSLNEVDFSESKLKGGSFAGSILSQAIFNDADISECDFRGAQNYSIDPRTTYMVNSQFSLPEAISLLHALDIKLDD